MTTKTFEPQKIDPRLPVGTLPERIEARSRFSLLFKLFLSWALISLFGFVIVNGLISSSNHWLIYNYGLVQRIQIAWCLGVGVPLWLATLISSIPATKEAKLAPKARHY